MNSYHQVKTALGSEVIINLISNLDEININKIFTDLWLIIEIFENKFSRFISDSELSKFNASAGNKQYVSEEFLDILKLSMIYSKKTNGLFNIFILPALQKSGYINSLIDNKVSYDFSVRSVVNIKSLKIGEDWAIIPYGTAIDIGGIGKGYIADVLANIIDKNKEILGYWISLGGDIVVGGVNSKGSEWLIKIQDAFDINEIKAEIKVPLNKILAVATSGIIKRKGRHNNEDWHHIIDPFTQKPAKTDILTATICTDKCIDADIMAKCAVMIGSKNVEKFIKDNKIPRAMIQIKEGKEKRNNIIIGDFISLNN